MIQNHSLDLPFQNLLLKSFFIFLDEFNLADYSCKKIFKLGLPDDILIAKLIFQNIQKNFKIFFDQFNFNSSRLLQKFTAPKDNCSEDKKTHFCPDKVSMCICKKVRPSLLPVRCTTLG